MDNVTGEANRLNDVFFYTAQALKPLARYCHNYIGHNCMPYLYRP